MAEHNADSSSGREPTARQDADPAAELERARTRLAELEARLDAILGTAVDGIVTIDERGVIESANAATQRIFGYPLEALIGRNVSMLMPDAERRRHDDYIRRYIETGQARIIGTGREVQGQRSDGSRLPMELAVTEMWLGERRLFTGILRDITARRRAEDEARRRLEQLAHAERLSTLGELTTVVAHEVNQPLTAIISFAEACLRMRRSGNQPAEKLDEALEQIVSQGQRAGEIIRQLRDLARKGDSVREPVALNDLVRSVLELFSKPLHALDARIELDLDEALPPVVCNRLQIEQVVINLLRNAMEAVERHPSGERVVRIATRACSESAVELLVEDDGYGIASDDAERIFEAFYTTKPEGLGMGLSVSRTIVEDHDGRLWATQGHEGGAVLHIELPYSGDG